MRLPSSLQPCRRCLSRGAVSGLCDASGISSSQPSPETGPVISVLQMGKLSTRPRRLYEVNLGMNSRADRLPHDPMPVAPTLKEGTSRARSWVPPQGAGGTPAAGEPRLAPAPRLLQVAGGHTRWLGRCFSAWDFFPFFVFYFFKAPLSRPTGDIFKATRYKHFPNKVSLNEKWKLFALRSSALTF